MPFYPQKVLTVSRIKPFAYPDRVMRKAMKLPGGGSWSAGQIFYETLAAANCVQTITFGGTVSGGSFTLLFASQTGYDSLSINYSGTAAVLKANIQAALDGYFGPSQVVVTGTGPFTLTYSGNLVASLDIPTPSVINNLTGSSPTIAAAQTTQGAGGLGYYQPYAGGYSSSTHLSFAILESNTRTDAQGNVLDEHGATGIATVAGFGSGLFLASQLIGLDTSIITNAGAGPFGQWWQGGWNGSTLYPNSVLLMRGT